MEQRLQQHSQQNRQNAFAFPQVASVEMSKADLSLPLDINDDYASSENDELPPEHNFHDFGQVK